MARDAECAIHRTATLERRVKSLANHRRVARGFFLWRCFGRGTRVARRPRRKFGFGCRFESVRTERIPELLAGSHGILFRRGVVQWCLPAGDRARHRRLHRLAVGKMWIRGKGFPRRRVLHVRQDFDVGPRVIDAHRRGHDNYNHEQHQKDRVRAVDHRKSPPANVTLSSTLST